MKASFIVGLIGSIIAIVSGIVMFVYSGDLPVNDMGGEVAFMMSLVVVLISILSLISLCVTKCPKEFTGCMVLIGGVANLVAITGAMFVNNFIFVTAFVLAGVLMFITAALRFCDK